jgi:ketosteroid isomerase-like protein
MSQENVELVRRHIEAWNRSVHPADGPNQFDFGVHGLDNPSGDATRTSTHRGREDVTRFFEDMRESFEEVMVEPDEWSDHGDRIVVFVRIRARPRGSDAVAESRVGHLWTLRDGKAIRCETFPRREDALQVVGLSE